MPRRTKGPPQAHIPLTVHGNTELSEEYVLSIPAAVGFPWIQGEGSIKHALVLSGGHSLDLTYSGPDYLHC